MSILLLISLYHFRHLLFRYYVIIFLFHQLRSRDVITEYCLLFSRHYTGLMIFSLSYFRRIRYFDRYL